MSEKAEQISIQASGPSKMTGFRLADDARRILFERAKILHLKPNELARLYVLEALMESQERSLGHAEIFALRNEIKSLRADLLLAVRALLSGAGKVSDADAAKWIEKNYSQS